MQRFSRSTTRDRMLSLVCVGSACTTFAEYVRRQRPRSSPRMDSSGQCLFNCCDSVCAHAEGPVTTPGALRFCSLPESARGAGEAARGGSVEECQAMQARRDFSLEEHALDLSGTVPSTGRCARGRGFYWQATCRYDHCSVPGRSRSKSLELRMASF